MSEENIGFSPPCPYCGATDHKRYNYHGAEIFACPICPEGVIWGYDSSNLKFEVWQCLECGAKGKGNADALFKHMESHKPNDFDEWSNYQGE